MSSGPKPNCPWRKPPKHPMDGALKIAHVLGGMFVGLVAGGMVAAFVWMVSEAASLWVPGSILLTAVTAGGVLGGVLGEPFFNWIGDLSGRLDAGTYHGAPDGMSAIDWDFDD